MESSKMQFWAKIDIFCLVFAKLAQNFGLFVVVVVVVIFLVVQHVELPEISELQEQASK